jgi:hypothetical protein
MNLNILQEQTCGGCTACCYAIGVEELGKPYFRHCEHQKASSCRIHETKPGSCKRYKCLYLQGAVKVRPDELGFIFQVYKDDKENMILEVIEIEDCPRSKWEKMSAILSEILNGYKVDAIKLFCWDTKIATDFHTTPIDTYVADGQENWHPWRFIENNPPIALWLKSDNAKTIRKIIGLASRRAI